MNRFTFANLLIPEFPTYFLTLVYQNALPLLITKTSKHDWPFVLYFFWVVNTSSNNKIFWFMCESRYSRRDLEIQRIILLNGQIWSNSFLVIYITNLHNLVNLFSIGLCYSDCWIRAKLKVRAQNENFHSCYF